MSDDSNFSRVWAKLNELSERINRCEQLLSTKIENPLPLKAQDITLSMLKAGDKNLTFKARVSKIDATKEGVKTLDNGEEKHWRLQIILVGDYTKQLPLQIWDKDIDTYDWIGVGDEIVLKDVYVNEYKSKLQIRLHKTGKIEPVEASIL